MHLYTASHGGASGSTVSRSNIRLGGQGHPCPPNPPPINAESHGREASLGLVLGALVAVAPVTTVAAAGEGVSIRAMSNTAVALRAVGSSVGLDDCVVDTGVDPGLVTVTVALLVKASDTECLPLPSIVDEHAWAARR